MTRFPNERVMNSKRAHGSTSFAAGRGDASAVDCPGRARDYAPQLVGKHVSIALYDGGAVAGTVREVQADALLIQVSKSTNPVAYPKGPGKSRISTA